MAIAPRTCYVRDVYGSGQSLIFLTRVARVVHRLESVVANKWQAVRMRKLCRIGRTHLMY
eukprot:scaffold5715_cov166-Amphora_coffeaeformis.AAC.8